MKEEEAIFEEGVICAISQEATYNLEVTQTLEEKVGYNNPIYLYLGEGASNPILFGSSPGMCVNAVFIYHLNSILINALSPTFKYFCGDEEDIEVISQTLLHENLHKSLHESKQIQEKYRAGEEIAVEALANYATMGKYLYSFEIRKKGRQRRGEKRRQKNGR